MVTYVRDPSGRFPRRPYFIEGELDLICETLIRAFLTQLHGAVRFPVETNDLTKLIERGTQSLDLYADLSGYGKDVEGVTEFRRGEKPAVCIAAGLSEDARLENRLRTTLSHEFGHVHLHTPLWELEIVQGRLPDASPTEGRVICKRESIIEARQSDWMEWQAGYASGALLMPKTAIRAACVGYMETEGLFGPVSLQTRHAPVLIGHIAEAFRVSREAARVRLLQLGLIGPGGPQPSLFN